LVEGLDWTRVHVPRIARPQAAVLALGSGKTTLLQRLRIRRTPVLQVENLADDAVPASHNPTIRSALATSDKEYVGIEGATHYYQNQPAQLHQCISAVLDWSRRKGLLAG
jgi:esterase/lipase